MNTRFVSRFLSVFLLFGGALSAKERSPIQPGTRIAIIGNTFADQLRTNGYFETLLLQHWEGNPVSIRNLGWAGDMLNARDRPTNFPTEESTLRDHQTDVIIACFGMGESFEGEKGIADFKSDLNAFIASHRGKKYNGESEVRLILVSPIAYENLGELTPRNASRNRDLQRYTNAMKSVATVEKIPFIDLFEPLRTLMNDPNRILLTTNGIHLSEYGYWVTAHILYDRLIEDESAAASRSWQIAIDTDSKRVTANGLEFSVLPSQGRELSFRVTEATSPSLPPPTNKALPAELAPLRDSMVVMNLKPGKYALVIDGEKVVSASHDEWAKGVAIDATPAHREAEDFRAAVNDKNLQFIYSWKALNQVHIVGERRHSPSGRALPAEILAFKEIANQKEKALHGALELKTREWRIIPDTN